MNHQLETKMKKTIKFALAKLALALTALSITPVFAHEHHGHESFSAGEPGDPQKPARTVEIALSEMAYEPSNITVKRGEQIRFVLRNVGQGGPRIPARHHQGESRACRSDEEAPAHGARRSQRGSAWAEQVGGNRL